MDDDKKLSDILQKFNLHAGKIMKIGVQISAESSPQIEWLGRVFKIARDVDPLCIITRCVDKMWDNKENILNKNEKFFIEKFDTSKYIKVDKNKEWLDEIVKVVRKEFSILSANEKSCIWFYLNEMLTAVIEYKLLKGEFE
jgi:hypothetical protein